MDTRIRESRRQLRSVALGFAAAVALWLGVRLIGETPAQAQVPDSGAQFNQMIVELQAANRQLAEMRELLKQIRDRQPPAESTKQPARRP